MSFLAIDVGNTRLKWALFDAPRPGARLLDQGAEFLEHIAKLADGTWSALKPPTHVLGCVVAADAIRRQVEVQMEDWDVVPRWVVASEAEAGLCNGYDHPSRLGADRWVAMIGAHQHMLHQGTPRPMVVVMVGTAVTVEAVDASGKFLGGLILPGHGIMLRALEAGTAGLHVPTGEVKPFPTNTSDAPHQRRHLRHSRCRGMHGPTCAPALRRRTQMHHDRRRRMEDGPQHDPAL